MSNYVINSNKCLVNVETAVNPLLAAFNITVDETDTLETVFNSLNNGINVYSVVGNDTSVYPVAISTVYGHRATVIAIKYGNGAGGVFIFIYDGEMYFCDVYTAPTFVTGEWYQVTTTTVNTADNTENTESAENTGNE